MNPRIIEENALKKVLKATKLTHKFQKHQKIQFLKVNKITHVVFEEMLTFSDKYQF